MAVKTIIPTSNVSMADIRDTLNANEGNCTNALGSFFKSTARINPWALNKPTAGGADFYATTEAFQTYAKSVYCGLTPQSNSYLLVANVNYSGTKVGHTVAEVQSANKEWVYQLPTTKPFRLGDFRGYRSNAIPPDGNYMDYDIPSTVMTTITNLNVQGETTTSGKNWYLSNDSKSHRLAGVSIKVGLQSYEGVNQDGLQDIPITYIQGDILTENWRLGLAVYIGTLASDAKWQLFVSDHTFNRITTSSKDAKYVLPDMATNQQAVWQMLNSSDRVFPYVPCLVKNCYLGFNAGHSYVYLTGESAVYSVPSGSGGMTIRKSSASAPNPLVNGKWSVKARFTGNYAYFGEESYNRIPINGLVVAYDGTLSTATNVDVQIAYTYLERIGNVVNSSIRFTTTLEAGFSEVSIYAAPGLQIQNTGTQWYKP